MYTPEEKKIAAQILENQEFTTLLAKIFLTTEDRLTPEVVDQKTNEELGEIVRANSLAELKVRQRFDVLKKIASTEGGRTKKVPR